MGGIPVDLFFQTQVLMPRGFAPGRHIFLDPFIIRDHLQDLPDHKLLDLLGGLDDRHRAEEPEGIEVDIILNRHRTTFAGTRRET